MALAFAKRLDHLNNDTQGVPGALSQLVAANGLIHFCYEASVTYDNFTHKRIYYRNYNTATTVLSAAVDVSGADPLGHGNRYPCIVRLDNGNLIIGWQVPYTADGATVMAAKIAESTDGGATWPYVSVLSYGIEWLTFQGLGSDGKGVYAICSSSHPDVPSQHVAEKLFFYRRTGPGTWTIPRQIFQGAYEDLFSVRTSPPGLGLIRKGNLYCIVGWRIRKTIKEIYAYVSRDTINWNFRLVDPSTGSSLPSTVRAVLGGDNIIRCVYSKNRVDGTNTRGLALSRDFGSYWELITEPAAFSATDGLGTPVTWNNEHFDTLAFTRDRQDLWFLSDVENLLGGRVRVFKATDDTQAAWSLLSSADIANGGITYDWRNSWPIPGSSCFDGADYYRAISVYDAITAPSTPFCQIWLLKEAGVGSGVLPSGGGYPRLFPD